MSRRTAHACFALVALALLLPAALAAATFHGRIVDDHWYEGRAVSTTYGGYDCRIRFHGDQVFLKLGAVEIVGVLDEDNVTDPHEIVAHDPKRGVDWTIDCYNLGN